MSDVVEHESTGLQAANLEAPSWCRADMATYFRKLRWRIKLALLTALLTPVIALSVYFHQQFTSMLRESSTLHVVSLAESQKNTIDLFLQERVANVLTLFRRADFTLTPSEDDMARHLSDLRQISDAFVDVGLCNSEGTQVGYAGPFPYLRGQDYSGAAWFGQIMQGDRDYYISDIYLGFRNAPHFTIAAKQLIGTEPYVIRATLDPDKFSMFLRNISRGKGVASVLINKDGYYQVVDPNYGQLLTQTDFVPGTSEGAGVEEVRASDASYLVAYVWLTETPWVLVVRYPIASAYAQLYRARRIVIAATSILILVMLVLIWLLTDRVLRRAQATALARETLQSQLLHAAKLASVGELAAGIAHEINNPLAIIGASSGVLRDLFDPEFNLQWTPETIRDQLSVIDTAVFRARDITRRLLHFSRENPRRVEPTDVHAVIDDVLGGFKERELELANISVVREYDPEVPELLLDPDQLGQVLLNLINNADDAIDAAGTIRVATSCDNRTVRITVADDGVGMSAQPIQKIFSPFYTTKEVGRGTGLGLSISMSIVTSMGGRIEVESMRGVGSAFTVVLPIGDDEGKSHESDPV